jgi:hypothetical protein
MRARLGILTVLVALGCGKQERPDPTAATLAEFSKRVDEYVALHDRLAAKVGPIDETKSQAEIAARAATLAHLIQEERAQAKQGDIFIPDVAAHLTTLIKAEYRRRPPPVKETREEQEEEHRTEGLPDFVPQVNQLYPTQYPLVTFPPALLALLPKLPPEVEYRTVVHYLILRDIEANLIIDLVPNAIP